MTNLNGGYVMLDLASTKVYEDAKAAVAAKKPILVYDNGKCYYADTFEVDGDGNVVITKGNTTITIEADGDVVKDVKEEKHLYRHKVYIGSNTNNIFVVVNDVSTPIDIQYTSPNYYIGDTIFKNYLEKSVSYDIIFTNQKLGGVKIGGGGGAPLIVEGNTISGTYGTNSLNLQKSDNSLEVHDEVTIIF